MAKRKTQTNGNKIKNPERLTFTTSQGIVLDIFPVEESLINIKANQIKKKYIEAGKIIEPPSVELETAPGSGKFELTLNIDNLEDPTDKDETLRRTNLWAIYLRDTAELNSELEIALIKLRLILGLGKTPYRTNGVSIPDEWLDYMESLGLELPENTNDRLYLYISSALLPSLTDKGRAISHIEAAQIGDVLTKEQFKEAVESVEQKFRSDIRKQMEKTFTENSSS